MLHETLHSIKQRKLSGFLLKIDFEKAYDKIEWHFLYQILHMKGFPDKWCDWIMKVVRGGHVGIKVNDEIGPFFKTFKGLRQEDPLSPLLFDIAADALTIMISRAQKHGLIKGLVSDLIPNGLAILQYADDTFFCCKMIMRGQRI